MPEYGLSMDRLCEEQGTKRMIVMVQDLSAEGALMPLKVTLHPVAWT
jgi:hypothetical protein